MLADADALPAAEREESIARQRVADGLPALRVEFQRVGVVTRIVVHDPRADEHGRAGRDGLAANLAGCQRFPADRPGGRAQAQRLFDDRAGVRQLCEIFGRWQAVAEYAIHLGLYLGLHAQVVRQQVECPGQQEGGRLVAGQQEGEGVGADLLVAELALVFPQDVDQRVFGLHRVRTGDQRGSDGIQVGGRALEVREPRAGEVGKRERRQREEARERHHRPADAFGRARGRVPEEGLHGDVEREARHLVGHVHTPAALPVRQAFLRALGDERNVGVYALGVEGGLEGAALGEMRLAFAGEQALAEQDTCALERRPFDKVVTLFHQRLLDEFGMVEQEDFALPDADVGDVALLA